MSFTLKTLWQACHQDATSATSPAATSGAPQFGRKHEIQFGSGQRIQASSAPDYNGNADLVNPEETLLASLSSCHMLTFLALAHKKRLPVDHYEDNASAELDTNANSRTYLARIQLRPKVTFAQGIELDHESLKKMHDKAHQHCFIANSILAEVNVLIQD